MVTAKQHISNNFKHHSNHLTPPLQPLQLQQQQARYTSATTGSAIVTTYQPITLYIYSSEHILVSNLNINDLFYLNLTKKSHLPGQDSSHTRSSHIEHITYNIQIHTKIQKLQVSFATYVLDFNNGHTFLTLNPFANYSMQNKKNQLTPRVHLKKHHHLEDLNW